jgi:acyl carrier protein
VSIIEIGAGTGSTTKFILNSPPSCPFTYLFTDLSVAFLKKAQGKFQKHPNITYHLYNVEKAPPLEWTGMFDVVVATNVLHATQDIRQTLRHVNALLRPGGIVILNEVTARQDYATVTFGLTDGWWMYTDERIPDSPLLTPQTWKRLLKEVGFHSIHSHGGEGQQVMVAVSHAREGEVRTPDTFQAVDKDNSLERPPQLTPDLASASAPSSVDPSLRPHTLSAHPLLPSDVVPALEAYLAATIAHIMKMDPTDICRETPFAVYGIDSLIVLELLKPLSETFGYLPSTLFFECPTLEKLGSYFLKEHSETVSNHFAPPPPCLPSPRAFRRDAWRHSVTR